MGSTHALMGMLIAFSGVYLFPGMAEAALIAGFTGGLFPDLDLLFYHRKTLHHPVIYSGLTLVAGIATVLFPGIWTVAVFFFVLASSVHSWVDILGGGLEDRPWEGTTDKGVYSYVLGTWFAPRQWIRYDGSPEDFALTVLLALPLYLQLNGLLETVVLVSVAISGIYTVLRKKLVDWNERFFL